MIKPLQPPCGRGNAPLLVAGATTFPPAGGLYSSLCVSFILPPLAGEVWRSRKGGGERSEPIRRMLIMSYDTESKSRNADFISIAAERQSATLGPEGPVKLKNPWARKGPSILRTFFRNPSTQPAAVRRPQPSGQSPVNPHAAGVSTSTSKNTTFLP